MSLIIVLGVASAEICKCLDDSIDAVASRAKKVSVVRAYYLVRRVDLLPPRNDHVALGSILT
jgi:hypothetical protein